MSTMLRYTLVVAAAISFAMGCAFPGGVASAALAPTLAVTPSADLTNGQTVTVTGTGWDPSSIGALVECNDTTEEPTVAVTGTQVPVGCSDPFNGLRSTNSAGELPPGNFTVKTGTVGPPETGTDSAGDPAAADAALYPCPPTQNQIDEGFSCTISLGLVQGQDVAAPLSFVGEPSPVSISSVSFTGGPANPTVVIRGTNFPAPPATITPGCGSSGENYVNRDLYLSDQATGWQAGENEDCFGLVVENDTSTVIEFTLGSYYHSYYNEGDLHLSPGDAFTVGVWGVDRLGHRGVPDHFFGRLQRDECRPHGDAPREGFWASGGVVSCAAHLLHWDRDGPRPPTRRVEHLRHH